MNTNWNTRRCSSWTSTQFHQCHFGPLQVKEYCQAWNHLTFPTLPVPCFSSFNRTQSNITLFRKDSMAFYILSTHHRANTWLPSPVVSGKSSRSLRFVPPFPPHHVLGGNLRSHFRQPPCTCWKDKQSKIPLSQQLLLYHLPINATKQKWEMTVNWKLSNQPIQM